MATIKTLEFFIKLQVVLRKKKLKIENNSLKNLA